MGLSIFFHQGMATQITGILHAAAILLWRHSLVSAKCDADDVRVPWRLSVVIQSTEDKSND